MIVLFALLAFGQTDDFYGPPTDDDGPAETLTTTMMIVTDVTSTSTLTSVTETGTWTTATRSPERLRGRSGSNNSKGTDGLSPIAIAAIAVGSLIAIVGAGVVAKATCSKKPVSASIRQRL